MPGVWMRRVETVSDGHAPGRRPAHQSLAGEQHRRRRARTAGADDDRVVTVFGHDSLLPSTPSTPATPVTPATGSIMRPVAFTLASSRFHDRYRWWACPTSSPASGCASSGRPGSSATANRCTSRRHGSARSLPSSPRPVAARLPATSSSTRLARPAARAPECRLQTQLTRVRRLLGPRPARSGDSAGYRLAAERPRSTRGNSKTLSPAGAMRNLRLRVCVRRRRCGGGNPSLTVPTSRGTTGGGAPPRTPGRGWRNSPGRTSPRATPMPRRCRQCTPARRPVPRACPRPAGRARLPAGRTTEAVHRYDEYRRRLAEELGLDPPPLLQQLERDILEHHLPFRPSKPSVGGDLPALPVSSFVGRERELQAVLDLVDRARIVTIVGLGFGQDASRDPRRDALRGGYPDGVWWCDLVATAPGEVATAVADRSACRNVRARPPPTARGGDRRASCAARARQLRARHRRGARVGGWARAARPGARRVGDEPPVARRRRGTPAAPGPLACTDRATTFPHRR